ncbi:GNAT family N-acetyltransferase [Candidatus Bathyarchaeota archaeon]|nr:MAG: GNAT family N-acetyltransferase [Candidatus Bathyarchaeota archaeon]
MGELVVKELTPSLRDDFLHFFDKVAFADNPDWSDCYCSAYHFANNKGKAESRREASSLIEEDRMHGFLAYDGGKPVGWCNAAPRSSYPGVQWLMSPGPDKYERVGSIVCFVIASTHRNQGVASQLLNAACSRFSQNGLEYAEAYPVKKPESAAYNFPGPLSMYLKNGFSTHRDADWYLVVRKRLEKPD